MCLIQEINIGTVKQMIEIMNTAADQVAPVDIARTTNTHGNIF